MKKGLKLKRKPSKALRFETALPMDAAMDRLDNVLEREFSLLHEWPRFRVSSERLHDSHYFEVRQQGNNWLPGRVVTGTIRQLNHNRSLVECEVKTVGRYLVGFEIVIVCCFFSTLITTIEGTAVNEYVIILWMFLAVSGWFIARLRRRLRQRTDPIIERIQKTLQD